jgi:glycosyltransferase involved in cell wall biosynthesis
MIADQTISLGVAVIGRNEGDRLTRCLSSVIADRRIVVYVDSGSNDGSIAAAQSLGAIVVDLDLSLPFTAARARNAGWQRLVELRPDLQFVQFVDGDCEVDAGWMDAAVETLRENPTVVVVCGRRRERSRDATVYNRLCDMEWDTPIGNADACGGDAMFRQAALAAAGGFRDDMIAGEEPELCHRLRQKGGKILRIDREMTRHDAAMTTFRQWWRRAVRAGHAYAEGASLTSDQSPGLWRREARSIWFWGVIVPTLAIVLAWWTNGWSLLLLLGYALLWLRVFVGSNRRWPGRDARTYATFCMIAKFAHVVGALRYYGNRVFGRRSRLIEYKNAGPVMSSAS